MRFEYKISVEVERIQGKFATKDELSEQIEEELASADPGNLYSADDAEYEVTGWGVERTDA